MEQCRCQVIVLPAAVPSDVQRLLIYSNVANMAALRYLTVSKIELNFQLVDKFNSLMKLTRWPTLTR